MTCIAALCHNGTIYMGGDSAGVSAGWHKTIRKDEKIFVNAPFIMGFTTSFRMGQLLRYKFNPPKQTVNQDDMKYMVTDFIDEARKCFAINGFGDKDATTGGTFLVGYNGNIYEIESDYQVALSTHNYNSVGCGCDLALGSLHTTEQLDIKPEKRIMLALEAASTFSAGVSQPFIIAKHKNIIKNSKINCVKTKK